MKSPVKDLQAASIAEPVETVAVLIAREASDLATCHRRHTIEMFRQVGPARGG